MGEEIVVCRGDLPLVRLVPVAQAEEMRRPKVGEITSEAVLCTDDAFSPLTDEELREWGL